MPKPKAPRWLTETFRDGVDDQSLAALPPSPYRGAARECWLARHDPRRRPCVLPLERAHLIPRQRVENALGAILLGSAFTEEWWEDEELRTWRTPLTRDLIWDLIHLAAWDPRNGIIACEHHHRRFDNHATPELAIPAFALPEHFTEFVTDWGLENAATDRFPGFDDPDRAYLWDRA